jgi:Asp-tRNA(Asn)/Glu-tRNA(Gln) amidotransferase A subunit family amidase
MEAFLRYEKALMENDLEQLDGLFAPGDSTLRGDASGLLIGHDTISAFRAGRGGAPKRTIDSISGQIIDKDTALLVAVTAPVNGGRGLQTQLWWRTPNEGWVIAAAHVSAPPPAIDKTIWRTVGTPLVRGSETGTLHGRTVAVKDIFAVAGHPIGAGIPAYLAESEIAVRSAEAVQLLLDAGASITGIARTDEFAYSIAGRNPHYGTPPNPAVVGGIPGGSSNGPAAAVATGQADIGLATDTAGSIRVPASYQGLFGLRTTHGVVSRDGLVPLAHSFDTVGWLARNLNDLASAAVASVGPTTQRNVDARYVALDLAGTGIEPTVAEAFQEPIAAMGGLVEETVSWPADPDELYAAFRAVQGFQAWSAHGEWIEAHPGALGAEIAARFESASHIGADEFAAAGTFLSAAAAQFEQTVGDRIALLPSASSPAPSVTADLETIERTRAATLRLTALAGITGRPALSVPALRVGGAPVGFCLVGPQGTDVALLLRFRDLPFVD